MDLQRYDKSVPLPDLRIYYIWEDIKKSHRNNRFKIPVTTWDKNVG